MRDWDKTTTTITVIPAQPGWFLSTLIESRGDTPACLIDEPIIAWEIEREQGPYAPGLCRANEHYESRYVRPITADPDCDGIDAESSWAIKHPDGKYQIPYAATFDDAAQLIRYFKPA
jgi:hypothetical protein